MLKNQFSIGILGQNPDSIAPQLAMWGNMKLWNVMWKKISGWWEEQDLLKRQIETETLVLKNSKSPDELRVTMLVELAEHLEVPLPQSMTAGDFDDLGKNIVAKAIVTLRKTDKEFNGTSANEMASHVLKKLFDDLQNRFEEQDRESQEKIVEAIRKGIGELPEDQKKRLQDELNVDGLTNEAVRKAIVTGSLGAAFAVVVEVAGFSAYMVAMQVLATVTGLIGITLPFAAYTTLTSMMAFLANPLIIGPAFLVFGYWLTSRGNRKIRDGLTPVLVTQALANSAMGERNDEQVRDFLLVYNRSRLSASAGNS
ncbi:MAG: hypothetical protein H6684_09360 [Deltaproteobacteria bacterium]|nr:hypothetical protein [Deltaproteobacteria bacterium]MCB9488923.1 hypothetical protein [Deltaproteobacteria bacterium]